MWHDADYTDTDIVSMVWNNKDNYIPKINQWVLNNDFLSAAYENTKWDKVGEWGDK